MLLERTQLENMKMAELRILNTNIGGDPVLPNVTKEELINRMLYDSAKQPKPLTQEEMTESKPEEKEVEHCTIEEVIKAVNPYILRGMKVYHDKDNDGWLFRVQMRNTRIRDANTGEVKLVEVWRDDSGTLKQPLVVIKRCANVLMQGVTVQAQMQKSVDPTSHYTAVA